MAFSFLQAISPNVDSFGNPLKNLEIPEAILLEYYYSYCNGAEATYREPAGMILMLYTDFFRLSPLPFPAGDPEADPETGEVTGLASPSRSSASSLVVLRPTVT